MDFILEELGAALLCIIAGAAIFLMYAGVIAYVTSF